VGKKWLVLAALGLALVVNPYLGCSESGESDFTYSEADMKLALLGSWEGTAEIEGVTTPFSLSLEQASSSAKTHSLTAPRAQPQCGSRSFVKPAAACASETTMPLLGVLSSENPALNGVVDGYFVAYRTLDSVGLHLRLDGGAVLSGRIEGKGLSEGLLENTPQTGSFVLSRP
jgi:hypothetical protein